MNINTMKGKSALLSGFLLMMMGSSGAAFAVPEQVDFTASVHVNRGTCSFDPTNGNQLTFDFGDVTPTVAMAGTQEQTQQFKLLNCPGVQHLGISLSSTSTITLASGADAGTWIIPAAGGATGVAYKTSIKSGSTGTPYSIEANDVVPAGSDSVITNEWSIYVIAKLIPTVASVAAMQSGSLASTAVLNITYL